MRAEIEAQIATHRLQAQSLEGRAHEAWLGARQAERRLDESRAESAALRRRLTSIAENPAGASDLISKLFYFHIEYEYGNKYLYFRWFTWFIE